MCLAFSGAGNQESDKLITLVIDAGHGGKDPGKPAGSKKYKHEKDINLDIALKVGKLLEDNVKGLKIIYTRKTDKWVNLDNRVIIANRAKADLFLSIHCNSNPNRHIYGTRTHFHDYRSVSTQKLAKAYESAYARAGRKSRGVQSTHDRGMSLFVLENTKMTAILTEVGFITNPTEEKYLNSSLGQTKLAKAIYDATVAHLKSTHGVKLKNGEVYYQVQILASSKKLNLKDPQFKKAGAAKITEKKATKGTFKYKYLIGRYTSKRVADVAARSYRTKGYKGAFVVKVEGE